MRNATALILVLVVAAVAVAKSDIGEVTGIVEDSGITIPYGGNMITADGSYYRAHGHSPDSRQAGLTTITEAVCPIDGTLSALAITSDSADATTVLKVLINEVVSETKTLTAATCVVSLSASVSAGDQLAVECDSGEPPDASTVSLLILPD